VTLDLDFDFGGPNCYQSYARRLVESLKTAFLLQILKTSRETDVFTHQTKVHFIFNKVYKMHIPHSLVIKCTCK